MSNPSKDKSLVILGVSLAIGLIISSFIIGGSLKFIKSANQSITVKGYAEKNITSDLVVWRSNISVRSSNLSDGYDRLQKDLKKVVDYLESKGVGKDRYAIGTVNTIPIFKYSESGNFTGIRDGYQLEQTITITSNDIQGIMKLSTDASEIIREGIEFQSYQPEFYYTKLNDMKIEMLAEASIDARQRAETLANNSGSKVGALKSAQQGVFQITSVHSSEISDFGMFDLSSIEKTIKSVVTMEYFIK